jgi:hypothetical protein
MASRRPAGPRPASGPGGRQGLATRSAPNVRGAPSSSPRNRVTGLDDVGRVVRRLGRHRSTEENWRGHRVGCSTVQEHVGSSSRKSSQMTIAPRWPPSHAGNPCATVRVTASFSTHGSQPMPLSREKATEQARKPCSDRHAPIGTVGPATSIAAPAARRRRSPRRPALSGAAGRARPADNPRRETGPVHDPTGAWRRTVWPNCGNPQGSFR